MIARRILSIFLIFIFFSISLFALDENEYYSSVAISDDGQYMCIATVHCHKDGAAEKHGSDCKDINKESIWIATTKDWRKHPEKVYTFNTLGWSHPSVCYDSKNDSFLVFHHSNDPTENGFYEFYRTESSYPDYVFKKFTPFESHSGTGILVKNDAGIFLAQDNLGKWPMTLDEWLDPINHFSLIYQVDVKNHNAKAKFVDALGQIKIMGIPLERKIPFKTVQDIQPLFATKNGLLICDYDTNSWWYYNCLDYSLRKFSSKEEAKLYDEMVEKQRTIDALLPEIKAKLGYESNSSNTSDEISQTISKALSEALPNNLPETIAETISQVLATALPPQTPDSATSRENVQNQSDDSTNQEQEDSISDSAPIVEIDDVHDKSDNQETPEPKAQLNLFIPAVILAALLLVAIAIIIILLRKKRKNPFKNSDKLEISRLVYQTQEQERASISRDIHDSVVQDMRGIRLETELLNVKDDSISRQKKIEDMATDCVLKLRNICYNLTPAELTTNNNNVSSKFELVSIIQTLAQQFTERTKIPCPVKVADGFKYSTYSKEISLNVFRVIQEALNNIEKHSYATNTSIYMQSDNNKMKIFITDDGIGFDTNVTQIQDDGLIHFGVQMMKDRMNLIGGSIKFISGNNDGTEIQLEFGE
ncbi:MAG: histidine kinase [Treponema sp.]|nr:histidine kinase [Treponema sp.]